MLMAMKNICPGKFFKFFEDSRIASVRLNASFAVEMFLLTFKDVKMLMVEF
jgi:hypothetical protein